MHGIKGCKTDTAGEDVAVIPLHISTITGANGQPAERCDLGAHANVLGGIFAFESFGFRQIAIRRQGDKIVMPGRPAVTRGRIWYVSL